MSDHFDAAAMVNMDDLLARLEESKRREARLTNALIMLRDDTLSPKQRRRIISEMLPHYQNEYPATED